MSGTGRAWTAQRELFDAPLVAGYALVTATVVALGVVDGAVRVLLGLPLAAALPGYALLSAAFPGDRRSERGPPDAGRVPFAGGLSWVERCSLSVPVSVALLPLVAIAVSLAGLPLATAPVTAALAAFVCLGVAVGVVRRRRLPVESRYAVPVERWGAELRRDGDDGSSGLGTVGTAVVAVAVLVAVGGLAVGLATPVEGDSYTDAALLTSDGSELVAGDYPRSVASDEPMELVLTVKNSLGESTRYETVVAIDRVERSDGGDDLTVVERRELSRSGFTVADGETAERQISTAPVLIGEDLRLIVFVYEGTAPDSPSVDGADEHLHLWIDVADGG